MGLKLDFDKVDWLVGQIIRGREDAVKPKACFFDFYGSKGIAKDDRTVDQLKDQLGKGLQYLVKEGVCSHKLENYPIFSDSSVLQIVLFDSRAVPSGHITSLIECNPYMNNKD
jgi:hypothetical protein